MKKLFLSLLCMAGMTLAMAQNNAIPHLETINGVKHMVVDGKPFLMLSGELHNSTGGSAHYMAPIWKRMADKNLNTVIGSVSWELLEPEEGKFDYSLVDVAVLGARKEGLKLVLIWFGSWKNAESTYVPAWVKQDAKRFPRVKTQGGKTLNMLSTFGEKTRQADANAFAHLMQHIREIDAQDHTVILMQVENEIGTYDMEVLAASFSGVAIKNESMRDYSDAANKAFKGQVPAELTAYLKAHQKELHPELLKVWQANGSRMTGTWEEVFGKGQDLMNDDWQNTYPYYTEEIFNAWNYARYVGEVARQGKQAYDIPMYVNCWLKQASGRQPGLYPSGAPQPHVYDIWRAATTAIDFFSPDIYTTDVFDWVAQDYSRSGNPLFIPETRPESNSASRAFYAYGRYHAMGYAPFGIDGGWYFNGIDPGDNSFDVAYECLSHLTDKISQYRGTDRMTGLYIDDSKPTDRVEMGDYVISVRKPSVVNSEALFGAKLEEGKQSSVSSGALIIQLADDEFLIAGGVGGITFSIGKGSKCKADHVAILSSDWITYDAQGHEQRHRLNGDEVSLGIGTALPGEASIFHVKMFKY